MSGERHGFMADPFHQVAVGAQHVSIMIDDVLAEFRCQQPLGKRHSDRGGDALPKRAGGGFDTGGDEILRMSRSFGAELTEILELIERHVLVAGQVKQRIEQHRTVPGRKDKAVAVRPTGVGGVELQELREQHGSDIRRTHRQAGMAGFRLLDGVHRQRADRIGHTGVIDERHAENPPEMRCLVAIRGMANGLGTSVLGNGK